MATNPKILKLIQALHRATASGRLQWAESGVRGYFDPDLEQGQITISSELEDGHEVYFVGLRGEKGRIIDSEFFADGDEGSDTARSLFQAVKRSAFHVDDIIDNVIPELEKISDCELRFCEIPRLSPAVDAAPRPGPSSHFGQ